MESPQAIKNLQEYIQKINKQSISLHDMNKDMNIWNDERIKSALAQIEMYKVGRGRLQI